MKNGNLDGGLRSGGQVGLSGRAVRPNQDSGGERSGRTRGPIGRPARFRIRHLLLALALALSALAWHVVGVTAQEAEPAAKPAVVKTERAKPRGRLPAYYARVVSATQREKIYDIQAKFDEQLKMLEEQLAALVSQRDSEVEAVLTAEQKQQIAAFEAEAKARRGASNAPAEEPPAADATKTSSTP
ncbi:MAG: hypothetical protein J5I93_29450 [Pirellulaceae bacterium]|nr:hypothetical protein [Pirellulaceae bacterium]